MIMMAGVMFFLYIGFNAAFHGDSGIKNTLWDSANKTLTGDNLDRWNDLMPQITQGFGISCVICFLLAIVFFVVEAFHKPPGGVEY
jgi:hypothetical protein